MREGGKVEGRTGEGVSGPYICTCTHGGGNDTMHVFAYMYLIHGCTCAIFIHVRVHCTCISSSLLVRVYML